MPARRSRAITTTSAASAPTTTTAIITTIRRFETYIVVDWSGAAVPRRGADSIWIGRRGADGAERVENPATRSEAERRLVELLRDERSVLVGFDFPFAYPAGLAARLGL